MKTIRARSALCALFIVTLTPLPAAAADRDLEAARTAVQTDLSLDNFFTAGWDEPWAKRTRVGGAPDLSLLRVQTNFLVRTLRTDYTYERPLDSSGERDVQFLNELVEWSFNRRFMLAVFGSRKWIDERAGEDRHGGTWGALARFQLVDTLRASYALNLRVTAPNDGLDEEQTMLSLALAGWHDLTPLGLDRMGLYWHVQEETFLGPHSPGTKRNGLTYAVSLAKTWTSSTAGLGNLSTFVEGYARTDLDGRRSGRTVVTLTPGFRFTVARRHVFMVGVEFPVSEPRPFEQIFRFTYLCSF